MEDLDQLEASLQAKYQKNSTVLDGLKGCRGLGLIEDELGRRMEEGREFLGKGWVKQFRKEEGGLLGSVARVGVEEEGKGRKWSYGGGIRLLSILVVVLAYVYKFAGNIILFFSFIFLAILLFN